MKKLISAILTATILSAALVGCGGASPSTSAAGSSGKEASPAAQTSPYPSFPVSVVVPFSAGGGTDLVTRAIVDAAKDKFPKNISVENRTGGGGAIGMVYGANAKPDGSIITTVCVELTTLPHTGTGATLQSDSFKPVMMMNSAYSVLTVKADAPWNDLKEFIEYAKTNKVQIGNSGVGAIWHLAAAALGKEAGVDFVHVPFEGAAPAVTSILGGHIEAVTVSYPEVAPQVEAGELKVLAVLAPERLKALPDVPTAKESGYDVAVGTWRGFGVPKDTPDETVKAIYDIFSEASNAPSFVEFMETNNLDIDVLDSKGFTERIASDDEMFKTLISDLGLAK